MPDIKISVALCTYNGATYITEQLKSIFHQSLPPDEVIICDDGSTDNTIALIKEYMPEQAGKIRVIVNPVSLGVMRNFEKALSLCSGEIIFLADQDDLWTYDKVKTITDYFQRHPDKNAVFTNASIIQHGLHTAATAWDHLGFTPEERKRLQDPLLLLRRLLLTGNLATGATMALRRSCLAKFLPFASLGKHLHDYQIALRTATEGSLGFIDEPLIAYRLHDAQQVGFRKRVVPMLLYPVYRLLQISKKALLAGKRKKDLLAVGANLQGFTSDRFPEAADFLEHLHMEKL